MTSGTGKKDSMPNTAANKISRVRLRRFIMVILLAAACIPVLIISGSVYYEYAASVKKNTNDQLKSLVMHHKKVIEAFLQEITAALRVVTHLQSIDQLNQKEILQKVFSSLQREYGHAFEDFGVIHATGVQVAYIGPYDLLGRDYLDAPWFKEVMARSIFISDVFLGFRQVPHFVVAVKQGEGQDAWVLRATVDAARFGSVVESLRLGHTGEAYIVNKDGVYETRSRSGGQVLERIKPGSIDMKPFEGVQLSEVANSGGNRLFRAKTWMKDNNWLLVVQQDMDEAFAEVYATRRLAIVFFVLGAVLVGLVTFFTTRLLVREIERGDEEKKALDEQLIQSAKLASIGELSAGIAHEINNPLAVIGQEAGWMQDILKRDSMKIPNKDVDELRDSLREIAQQTGRCKEITHKLLSFARKMESVIKDVNLSELIEDVVGIVEREAILNNIQIHRKYHEHLPLIYSDPSQLRQVLLNLFNNAMDAIQRGGEIKVETTIGDDDMVTVKVRDTGGGIPEENLKRIFDPFFTTKPPGKGTGLGLSICHGIIDKLGGKISVVSHVGKGTTFTIDLPLEKTRGET